MVLHNWQIDYYQFKFFNVKTVFGLTIWRAFTETALNSYITAFMRVDHLIKNLNNLSLNVDKLISNVKLVIF